MGICRLSVDCVTVHVLRSLQNIAQATQVHLTWAWPMYLLMTGCKHNAKTVAAWQGQFRGDQGAFVSIRNDDRAVAATLCRQGCRGNVLWSSRRHTQYCSWGEIQLSQPVVCLPKLERRSYWTLFQHVTHEGLVLNLMFGFLSRQKLQTVMALHDAQLAQPTISLL